MFKRKFHKLPKTEQESIFKKMIQAGTAHDDQTHRQFAEKNTNFVLHCQNAGVECTRRQASKYRRKMGSAYKFGRV